MAVVVVMDPLMSLVGSESAVGVAGAELCESVTFPGFDLATVLDQLGRVQPGREALECAAGVDFGELVVVTHEHDLGASRLGVVEEPGELACAHH